jgi:hypothetical protein
MTTDPITREEDIWSRRMNDINDWKRYYGEERVKRAELEVATDELVEAAEMVLACIDQPRSRDNSEHTGIDAAEALRKATAEVKEFNSATLKYVHGLAAGDLPMVGDLVMLVARLARKLRKAAPADELPAQALDYLNRNGLKGSPLREVGAGGTAEQKYDELLFAVGRKFRDESRHETALRYIREAEAAEKVCSGDTAAAVGRAM